KCCRGLLDRPAVAMAGKALAQPVAELIATGIAGDLIGNRHRLPGQRRIAGGTTHAHLAMFDEDLRARLRPGIGGADDDVDIDIADHRQRPYRRYICLAGHERLSLTPIPSLIPPG